MNKEYVLSVVIPCYNEKDNIISIVKEVSKKTKEIKEV